MSGDWKSAFWKVWARVYWLVAAAILILHYWAFNAFGAWTVIQVWAAAFAAIGAAVLIHHRRAVRRAEESLQWPTAEARILKSEVREERSTSRLRDSSYDMEETVSYYPEVEYEYEAGGRTWRSSRILHVNVNYSLEGARSTVARYPAGARVQARYNFADPGYAVLEPGLSGKEAQYRTVRIVGIVFLALGAVAFIAIKAFFGHK